MPFCGTLCVSVLMYMNESLVKKSEEIPCMVRTWITLHNTTWCDYFSMSFLLWSYGMMRNYIAQRSLELIIYLFSNPNKSCLDTLVTWWRHQMETVSALLALCEGIQQCHRWISIMKASDAKLWYFLWSAHEQTVEQTIETPVIWDTIVLIITSS